MKLSMCLSIAAGFAAAVGSAEAQQTTYFNAGRPDTLNNNGAINFVGFSSGKIAAGSEQRWSAQAFTIGAGGADIGEIDAEAFPPAGAEFGSVAYIIWARNAGNPAPVAADQLFTGSVPAPTPVADPRIAQPSGTYQLVLPSVVHLNPGNYWLTLYADSPATGNTSGFWNFAWFGNCQPDPVFYSPVNTPIFISDVSGAFMWRSATFPSPGFAQYRPATLTVDPAPTSGPVPQDPNYIWNCSFALLSAPPLGACCKADGTCSFVIPTVCATQSGLYQGAGVTCAAAACPQPGACCMADGTCQQTAASLCYNAEGVYRGNNSTCASAGCTTTGACCQMDGTCSLQNEGACRGTNGLYRGAGSTCAAANCPSTYTYPGVPITIIDAVGTVCGTAVVAELNVTDSFTIGAADVSMFVTHTYQGDLQLWLKHVQTGTTVRVVNQPSAGVGGFSADNYGTAATPLGWFRLIDTSPNFYRTSTVPFGIPPATGIDGVHWQWKPEAPLSAPTPAGFAGENSAGQWQLIAQDCGPGDTGNIETWALSLQRPGAAACYANCDSSTTAPVLNVADFTCFLQRYAAADAYANCDASTTAPVLNVADFTCFLQKYAAGCP